MEMLNEWRFSTSTLPLRSNSTPRGARSASVRWWLFSAISSNFACWTTCSTQKLTASTANTRRHTRPAGRRAGSLTLRRSSIGMRHPVILALDRALSSIDRRYRAPVAAPPPFDRPRQRARPAETPRTPTSALPSAWLEHRPRTALRELPQVEQRVQPHEHDRVQRPSPRRTPRTAAAAARR